MYVFLFAYTFNFLIKRVKQKNNQSNVGATPIVINQRNLTVSSTSIQSHTVAYTSIHMSAY